MDKLFWRNKKVFLTGHTGFKGAWLSLWLQHLGAEVTGFALKPPSNPSFYDVTDISKNMVSIEGDVRDFNALKEALVNSNAEIVFHLAAQSLVRLSYENPIETYSTNIMGTVNLLEAVRNCSSVRSVVNITTDKCYENKEWLWSYRENEPLGGYDPYSSSKACSELVTSSFTNSFFNPKSYEIHGVAIATARAGNVIGGGDWSKDRLIPDILNSVINKQPVKLRNPRSVRPWQHVLEPLDGYLKLAQKLYEAGGEYSSAWNFGPKEEDAKSVGWVCIRLLEMMGAPLSYETLGEADAPHEAHILKLNISKAMELLGWQPKTSILQGISMVANWTKEFNRGADMLEFSLNQIFEYESLIRNESK